MLRFLEVFRQPFVSALKYLYVLCSRVSSARAHSFDPKDIDEVVVRTRCGARTYLVALARDGVLADLVSLHHHFDAAVLVVLENVAVHLESGWVG